MGASAMLVLTAVSGAAADVTTSFWAQFSTAVYSSNAAQPEWVNVAGGIHVVTGITQPSDSCQPGDPCRAVPVTVHLNLAIGIDSTGAFTIDEIRIGTTYAGVAPAGH